MDPKRVKRQPLTLEAAQATEKNIRRLSTLMSQKIKTRLNDAEIENLKSAVEVFISTYAPDMLQGFIAYHTEYVPLVNALVPSVGRIFTHIQAIKGCDGVSCGGGDDDDLGETE